MNALLSRTPSSHTQGPLEGKAAVLQMEVERIEFMVLRSSYSLRLFFRFSALGKFEKWELEKSG